MSRSKTSISSALGRIRLIAGEWRGRRLPVPDRPGLRPTPDRVRETLFNWLMPVIEGSRCLDLYAGSGALGLEAASRGAASVTLVERDPAALAQLHANRDLLAADQVAIESGDALAWLQRGPARPHDIVFVDPPYADQLVARSVAALLSADWLAAQALVYLEWPAEQGAPVAGSPWREARAGSVRYALYRRDQLG